MSAGCSREPTVRKLKRDLYEARVRIDALDSFARRAGGILEQVRDSPEDVWRPTLLGLVEEYEKLFPSDQSLEF